jgi:dTDP-4-dehydrorhamnose 3,5-epimerase
MKFTETKIPGLWIIETRIFKDARGFFQERFKESVMRAHGIRESFVQDNHSRSAPKVLRGLHFQTNPPQGKLVSVTRGRIWDVAVDLRRNSAHYGQHFGLELSDQNGIALWIPFGFAHGFCVTGEEDADVVYKVTGEYNAASESGICWNDKDLDIPWPVKEPIVSERDQKLAPLMGFPGL